MKAVRLLVCVAVVALLASCSEPSAPPPAPSPDALFGFPPPPPPAIGLVQCTPLPYDSVTQTIGPDGGVISVGEHTLWIPAGALDTDVTITAVAPSDTLRHVRFQPEGLTFQKSAWLSLSYEGCNLLGSLAPKRIAYTTDVFEILEYLLSFDNPWSQKVTGRVQHFSEYAVAW